VGGWWRFKKKGGGGGVVNGVWGYIYTNRFWGLKILGVRRGGLWEVFWPLRGGVVFWSFSGSPLQSSFAMGKKKKS